MELREKVIRTIVKLGIKQRFYTGKFRKANGRLHYLKKRRNKCRRSSSIEKLEQHIKPLQEEYDYWSVKLDKIGKAIEQLHDYFEVWEDDDDFIRISLEVWTYEESVEEAFKGVLEINEKLDEKEFQKETA